MYVDERSRLQLAEAAKRLLGADEGITLMELLPPVGWADVATKDDLAQLEARIDLRFEKLEHRFGSELEILDHKLTATLHQELRSQTWKLFTLVAAAMSAMLGALVGVARF